MFEAALKKTLLDDPKIKAAIVGVHAQRRPQSIVGGVQVVLRRIATNYFQDLPGEGVCSQPTIQITAIGDENTAPYACANVLSMIRQKFCEDSFRGGVGAIRDGYEVHGVTTERDSSGAAIPPVDGSDNWTFEPSIDLRFTIRKL